MPEEEITANGSQSYTRVEHLRYAISMYLQFCLTQCSRRHKQMHVDQVHCKHPGCGKIFYRLDLLQRHEERQ